MLQGIGEDALELFGHAGTQALGAVERPLLIAEPGETLEVAVNRMWWRKVGALPVMHEGRLVGCFAEEDLLRILAARVRESQDPEGQDVWGTLLGDVRVRDAMSPVGKLPVVSSEGSLLAGLRECCAPGAPRGRYLFVVDATDSGDAVQLLSFRDIARFSTAVYAGKAPSSWFGGDAGAGAALMACRRLLSHTLGTLVAEGVIGHEANTVSADLDGASTVHAMADGEHGYVLVTIADGGPIGICTRRDILRGIRPRHARIDQLAVERLMSQQVQTVLPSNTLTGLFHLMAMASCRHMPMVDGWDHVECVVSMWEAIALVAGVPRPS
ncbi:MAG: CBS domain-containing protein [Myxococcota bacterium]|nr:CBS domain-containing protein [Myxococcota bacterium]